MSGCVARENSLEIRTLTKVWIADQYVATRDIQMVAIYQGSSDVIGLISSAQLSCTDFGYMTLILQGRLINLIAANRLPVS